MMASSTHFVASSTHFVVGAALFFSLCTACAKGAGPRIPTYEKVFIRSFLNAAYLVIGRRRALVAGITKLDGGTRALLVARGAAGFVALFCYFEGTQILPLAHLTIITRLHPALSSLACAALLGEALRREHYVLLASSLAGVALVAQPSAAAGAEVSATGVAIALTAAVFTAVAFTLVRALNLRGVPPDVIIFAFHAGGGLLSALLGGAQFVWPRQTEWRWLWGTVITMQLAQACMTRLLRARAVASAAPSSFLIVVFNILCGLALGDPFPNAFACAGCALIVGPLALVERARSRRAAVDDEGDKKDI